MQRIKNITEPIAKQYQLPTVYLFGSYARGTATEGRDIDPLVDTTGTSLTSLFPLGTLYCNLENALKKPIDLIAISPSEQRAQMPGDFFADKKQPPSKKRETVYSIRQAG
ncbi:MAG: nucleotidyltransferase family protein [Hominicoprocola sp.]